MRSLAALIVIAGPAFAQNKPAVLPAACGPINENLHVHRDQSQHSLTPPESGKARVYFIQDLGVVSCIAGCYTVRAGVDGTWVGATNENSYFSVSVEPGEHHLCVSAQGRLLERQLGLAHLLAEPGKTYFFRVRIFSGTNQGVVDLASIDRDQGEYLIASYPLSISRVKSQSSAGRHDGSALSKNSGS